MYCTRRELRELRDRDAIEGWTRDDLYFLDNERVLHTKIDDDRALDKAYLTEIYDEWLERLRKVPPATQAGYASIASAEFVHKKFLKLIADVNATRVKKVGCDEMERGGCVKAKRT